MFVLSMLGGAAQSGLGALGSLFSTVLGGASTVVKGAIGLFATGVSMFVNILRSSIATLMDFSKTVSSISNQTGASVGQSLKITNRFRALGIAPEETAKIFGSTTMNPTMFNQRAIHMGAPTLDDPNFEVKLNKWFQQQGGGVNGFLGKRGQLDALFDGNVTPGLLNKVNSRPETLQKELNYNSDLQSKMGLSPEIIRRASDDFPLLVNRIYMFIDAVKMRFAGELLPTLEWVFDFISKMMMQSADSIAGGIRQFAKWAFTELPYMAINGLRAIISVAHGISESFFSIAEAGIGLMRGMGSKSGVLYGVLAFVAGFMDDLNNLGANFMAGLTYVLSEANNFLVRIPGVKEFMKAETGVDVGEIDTMKATEGAWRAQNPTSFLQQLNTYATSGEPDKIADVWEKNIGNLRSSRDNIERTATGFLDNQERALGPKHEREQSFASIGKEIVDATKAGSENVVNAINKQGGGGSDAYAPALGHVLASYALRSRRRG